MRATTRHVLTGGLIGLIGTLFVLVVYWALAGFRVGRTPFPYSDAMAWLMTSDDTPETRQILLSLAISFVVHGIIGCVVGFIVGDLKAAARRS
jgi:hypothetical protein